MDLSRGSERVRGQSRTKPEECAIIVRIGQAPGVLERVCPDSLTTLTTGGSITAKEEATARQGRLLLRKHSAGNSCAVRGRVARYSHPTGVLPQVAMAGRVDGFDPEGRDACCYQTGSGNSNQLPDFIGNYRGGDFHPFGSSAGQGFREMKRLFRVHFRRHGRFVRIHDRLDDDRPGSRERFLNDLGTIPGILDREPFGPARPGKTGEINGVQIAAVFWISQENHLLPFDHAQRVVFDDEDFYWQLVFHRGRELRHQHAEPPVSDKGDALTIWIRDLGGDGVRQTVAH